MLKPLHFTLIPCECRHILDSGTQKRHSSRIFPIADATLLLHLFKLGKSLFDLIKFHFGNIHLLLQQIQS